MTAAAAAKGADPAPRHTVEATYLDPTSASFRFRQRRFAVVRAMIDEIVAVKGSCRIADIGGTDYYWRIAADLLATAPVEIDLFNLEAKASGHPKIRSLVGNATRLDHIADDAYDLVHSNSVVEHVGDWSDMVAMAAEVRRIAPAYYVQTPNFWFPYEPHFRAPLFHWLPEQVRARLLMRFNLGFGGRRDTLDAAMRAVQSARMLDGGQVAALFPDAEISRERYLGLTKSWMAVRRARG
ncbi:MAG: class I SAM-dependent methyltransferase [Hyphomicrobiaceae bacterium]